MYLHRIVPLKHCMLREALQSRYYYSGITRLSVAASLVHSNVLLLASLFGIEPDEAVSEQLLSPPRKKCDELHQVAMTINLYSRSE